MRWAGMTVFRLTFALKSLRSSKNCLGNNYEGLIPFTRSIDLKGFLSSAVNLARLPSFVRRLSFRLTPSPPFPR
jgi:hypothetical protein